MILVDSCAWSLAFRRHRSALSTDEQQIVSRLSEEIRHGNAAIIGPIRQEVLSGIKDDAQFEKLRKALAHFRDEPIFAADYEEAARLFNRCRSHGVECGATDILLCAVALRLNYGILTTDRGLSRCMTFLKV